MSERPDSKSVDYYNSRIFAEKAAEIYKAADRFGKVTVLDDAYFPDPVNRVTMTISSGTTYEDIPAYVLEANLYLDDAQISGRAIFSRLATKRLTATQSAATDPTANTDTYIFNDIIPFQEGSEARAVVQYYKSPGVINIINKRLVKPLLFPASPIGTGRIEAFDPPTKEELRGRSGDFAEGCEHLLGFGRFIVRAAFDAIGMKKRTLRTLEENAVFYGGAPILVKHSFTLRLHQATNK
jgi:hypothetical protein